jgi:energy-coupling factor transporter ATP-binding protein EcfA2
VALQLQLLLLDEPFAAPDALTRIKMQSLVRALVRKHRPGVRLVTHDVDEAITLGDRALMMRDGAIARSYSISPAASGHRSRPAPKRSTCGIVCWLTLALARMPELPRMEYTMYRRSLLAMASAAVLASGARGWPRHHASDLGFRWFAFNHHGI